MKLNCFMKAKTTSCVFCFNVLKSFRALCPHFSVCFSILITSFGEEGAGLCASRTFVCLFCAFMFFVLFSSSWCRGLAAVCDCGIPWTLLLTFLVKYVT